MKRKALLLFAVLVCAALALSLGCSGDDKTAANATDVPVITLSPDGAVTAGPTATPETQSDEPVNTAEGGVPVSTDVPVITESPGGEVTAGPTATPVTVTREPVYTNVPVITQSPQGEVTAGPTATPTAAPTQSGGEFRTQAPTNPTQAPSTPTQAPSNPTPIPVNPTQAPSNPTQAPANPTQAPSNPTQAPSNPTQAPANPTPAPRPTPSPDGLPQPAEPNDFSANYAGAVVDCSSLSAGGTFFWTLDLLNEHSCLYAGHWLVEYDDEYLEPQNYSVTWSGGLTFLVNSTWDDGEAWSDKPQFVCNLKYEGMTGQNPYGEAGKNYSMVLMYLTTFDYNGVQMAGPMARIKYKVLKVPAESAMLHDAEGYYLPLKVTVINSAAMISPAEGVTHGNITVSDGKLYFKH